jgi:hypothetical protein
MSTDAKLIQKGMNVSREGLVVQAGVHIALEQKYRAPLAKKGWTPANTTMLVDSTQFLLSERAAALDARDASKSNLNREHEAVAGAKAFKRVLVHAFNDLYAEGSVSAEVRSSIGGAGRLDRNTTRIINYLNEVEPRVRAAEELLKPYFEGGSATAELVTIAKELSDAQTTQETDYAGLPVETQKVYAAKGQVLLLIEKMNRIGKIAFDGQASTIALFNKDLILRATRTRKAAQPAASEGASSS